MYAPKYFNETNKEKLIEIIDAYPFATVMSYDESKEPFFSHLPLLLEKKNEGFTLLGHMAKRNPQWRHFAKNPQAKIIFHGPHAYITPRWYRSGRDVPTWNYVAVHMTGQVRLIHDFEDLVTLLKSLTGKFEAGSVSPWEFELPDDLLSPEALSSAIVGFEVEIEKIDAKFKLSQNRSAADKEGMIEGLSQRHDDASRALSELMKRE